MDMILKNFFLNFFKILQIKWLTLNSKSFFFLFSIFFGILCGSLFGTFLPLLRSFVYWDGFIILSLLAISELLNFSIYQNQIDLKKNYLIEILNWIKIGLFLGFFIDAFKVGS